LKTLKKFGKYKSWFDSSGLRSITTCSQVKEANESGWWMLSKSLGRNGFRIAKLLRGRNGIHAKKRSLLEEPGGRKRRGTARGKKKKERKE
jgi:hypothetical protein